jgi:hypothetical protein
MSRFDLGSVLQITRTTTDFSDGDGKHKIICNNDFG